ncbi:MAG: sterol desaturase family protein [Pseudomonadota bacterium]
MSREWNFHPELPVAYSPLFEWPPRPRAIAGWFSRAWLPISEHLIYVALALAVLAWLQPPLNETATLEAWWIFEIWARNMIMFIAVAGGLHLWLYTWRKQGDRLKYDYRDLAANNGTFAFRSQLWDNVMWGLASGVTFWTAYEAGMFWAYSNGWAPIMTFSDNPIWFLAVFLLIPVYHSFHFYWVHRLLHWPPLYRLAHSVHHRNVNTGPWSGFSMHPVEHFIYVSGILVHLIVPSDPIHMVFHMYWITLATATSHSGYESVLLGDRAKVDVGTFFHQLHHRYFECNYGNMEMPWDRWFGSYHDGSPEGTAAARARMRAKMVNRVSK